MGEIEIHVTIIGEDVTVVDSDGWHTRHKGWETEDIVARVDEATRKALAEASGE